MNIRVSRSAFGLEDGEMEAEILSKVREEGKKRQENYYLLYLDDNYLTQKKKWRIFFFFAKMTDILDLKLCKKF